MREKWGHEGTKMEARGVRSTAYADRHRLWGRDCPATDLDEILCAGGSAMGGWMEYDEGEPVALIETKCWPYEQIKPGKSQASSLARLATRASLPIFGVEWWRNDEHEVEGGDGETWYFHVVALNDLAYDALGGAWHRVGSEYRYVRLLYDLRGKTMPGEVRERLSKANPPSGFFDREL